MAVVTHNGVAKITDAHGRMLMLCPESLLDDLAALPAPTQEPGRATKSQPEPTFEGKRMAQWKADRGRRR